MYTDQARHSTHSTLLQRRKISASTLPQLSNCRRNSGRCLTCRWSDPSRIVCPPFRQTNHHRDNTSPMLRLHKRLRSHPHNFGTKMPWQKRSAAFHTDRARASRRSVLTVCTGCAIGRESCPLGLPLSLLYSDLRTFVWI